MLRWIAILVLVVSSAGCATAPRLLRFDGQARVDDRLTVSVYVQLEK